MQHLNGSPQAAGAGERAVKLYAAPPGRAGEFHARKLLAHADLQVGKGLVVLEVDVEARLDILDQAGFHQQRVDLGLRLDKIDIGDDLDKVGGAHVLGGDLREIVARAIAQVLGFADVDDPYLGILHQVNAGRERELLHLLRRSDDDRIGQFFGIGHG